MKALFQFIRRETGERSEVLEMTREELATELLRTIDYFSGDDEESIKKRIEARSDYLLVLMEKPSDDEEYQFSAAPLFSNQAFIDHIYTLEQQIQIRSDFKKLEKAQNEEFYA